MSFRVSGCLFWPSKHAGDDSNGPFSCHISPHTLLIFPILGISKRSDKVPCDEISVVKKLGKPLYHPFLVLVMKLVGGGGGGGGGHSSKK